MKAKHIELSDETKAAMSDRKFPWLAMFEFDVANLSP